MTWACSRYGLARKLPRFCHSERITGNPSIEIFRRDLNFRVVDNPRSDPTWRYECNQDFSPIMQCHIMS